MKYSTESHTEVLKLVFVIFVDDYDVFKCVNLKKYSIPSMVHSMNSSEHKSLKITTQGHVANSLA